MTIAPPTLLASPPQRPIVAAFARGFNVAFSVFEKRARWECVSGECEPGDWRPDVNCLEEVHQTMQPRVQFVAPARPFLLAPSPDDETSVVLVGALSPAQVELAVPLASALLRGLECERRLAERTEQLEEYADQVTKDFEELTCLRSLAEHIDLCEPRNELGAVAASVLPTVRDIVRAGAILLYETHDEGRTWALACAVGEAERLAEAGLQVIERLGPLAGKQPVVRNANAFGAPLDGFEGVRNCILVRLAKGSRSYGWLVALNKHVSPELELATHSIGAGDENEWAFGTIEAGLLNSAGIMLTMHAHNRHAFWQIEQLLGGVIRAIINAVDAKDAYTCGHSDRVASMARRIAEQLRLSSVEQQRIYMAGLLHDVGKIGGSDRVLGKPDRLTEEEFAEIKRHPEIGYGILKHVSQLREMLPGVLHHHESFDGRGYPHGLAGDQIPLMARILAVADAYDAMTSSRPYRVAMSVEKAESILQGGSGRQWDAQVVEAFFQCLDDIHRICGLKRSHTVALLAGQPPAASGTYDQIAEAVMATLT